MLRAMGPMGKTHRDPDWAQYKVTGARAPLRAWAAPQQQAANHKQSLARQYRTRSIQGRGFSWIGSFMVLDSPTVRRDAMIGSG
jgi:hypothetical protein